MDPVGALAHLGELSSGVRAAVLLDGRGRAAAATRGGQALDVPDADGLGELCDALLSAADDARGGHAAQVEVRTVAGTVFALRTRRWSIAVVAERDALASLMFYDLRSVLDRLAPRAAA